MYRVAGTTEYLAITGSGINDIKLAKKAWIWPFQSCAVFNISPVNYTLEVHAMSAEKLPFILPAVFTIGPKDDPESLLKYAKLLCPNDRSSKDIKELVQGVIEGETRVLAAGMTMEEVFKGTKEFKKEVFDKVQLELNQFGLFIYNANIKQLVDIPGHEYFSYLGRKIQNEAANQAKIDISEAKMKGEIGSKKREGQTTQNAAQIDAETKIITTQRIGEGKKEQIKVNSELEIYENQRKAEVATNRAQCSRQAQLAEVEAQKAVAIKEAELQKEVEVKKALTRTEQLKAELLSKASVEYDIKVQEANSELYKKQKAADAVLFEKEKQAEAQRKNAEAALFARQQEAEGELYAKKKEAEALMELAEAKYFARRKEADGELFAKVREAEGLEAMARAQGVYVETLLRAFGGNYAAMRDFLMINDGSYKQIAKINAGAVAGLKPNISVWTTGGQTAEQGGNSAMQEIAGLYRTLPPLLKTVQEQTGMNPPSWLATLGDSGSKNLALQEP